MNHNYMNKNHITISLGVSKYWLSLIHINESGYETKELALVEHTPSSHFMGSRCVPLNEWFDSSCTNDECVVDLINAHKLGYHLLKDASEALVIHAAITRALEFINRIYYWTGETQ